MGNGLIRLISLLKEHYIGFLVSILMAFISGYIIYTFNEIEPRILIAIGAGMITLLVGILGYYAGLHGM